MGCLERKLSRRGAGARGGDPWFRFDEEVFKLKPVAYRCCQEQNDKEDRQRQRDLVKVVTCAGCDGDRQYQYKSDSGYDHYRQSGSAQRALLCRSTHRHRFYRSIKTLSICPLLGTALFSRPGQGVPAIVWSAALLQGKSEGVIDRSAQMYSAFGWRIVSPGHDELRCVLSLINGTVMEDHLREQVASTPLGTVRSS